ncbi:MAG: hypothetical protein AAF806_01215 [Bacteroidota bacterium]
MNLKVLFICGSLEQEKDGVGDYSRRLAGEMIRKGCKVFLLAINDIYLERVEEAEQYDLETTIESYRLPKSLNLQEKERLAASFVHKKNPDWLSLQYVPFSFNDRGLPYQWNKVFQAIGKGRKWHLMFHELWLGIDSRKHSLKHKTLGMLQRIIIKSLIKDIKPASISTQLLEYQNQLRQQKISSQLLPLFGNIPFSCQEKQELNTELSQDTFHILYFGSAPGVDLTQLILKKLIEFRGAYKLKWNLIYVGKASSNKAHFLDTIQQNFEQLSIDVIDLGHLHSEDLSQVLSIASVGIARSSLSFLGKSGSAVAMLEHGLPIWLPKVSKGEIIRLKYPFRKNIIFDSLDKAYKNSNLEKHKQSLLPIVAESFINLVAKNSTPIHV